MAQVSLEWMSILTALATVRNQMAVHVHYKSFAYSLSSSTTSKDQIEWWQLIFSIITGTFARNNDNCHYKINVQIKLAREKVIRVIGVLNRTRQLWNSEAEYRFIFVLVALPYWLFKLANYGQQQSTQINKFPCHNLAQTFCYWWKTRAVHNWFDEMQALGPAKRHCWGQMREEQSRIKYCSQKEWFSSL